MEFVHLIGSEKVQQAGTDIAAAAQFMDEWLARLEAILKQKED